MSKPMVGIIGASGSVGRVVAQQLHTIGVSRLRIGARNTFAIRHLADDLNGPIETAYVDVRDPESLARFCCGCRVIVNCAGPSFRLLDLAARGAFAAGADYVDPGGDEPVYKRLASLDLGGAGRVALLTAGMMPGLSALLVRWMALEGFERATRLLAYVGGRDHLSQAGAVDYILSIGQADGEALAIWQNGGRVARALTPLTDAVAPFFPPGVTAYPYLSAETERLARALNLVEVRWYNVFEGRHMLKALGRLQGAMLGQTDVDDAASDLSKAAELDLFGLTRYQLFYLQLEGELNGQPVSRGILLQGAGAHELTGCMSALATVAVLNGEFSPGLYFTGEALRPCAVEQLRRMPEVTAFQVIETAAESDLLVEEGEL